MTKLPALFALCAFALLQACSGNATEEEALVQQKLAELDWLVGSWEGRVESDKVYEQWTKKTDNSLHGIGFIISGKSLGQESQPLDTIFSERMEIDARQAGNIALKVRMAGQENTVFTATEIVPGKAVFENPEHDFPSRIVYTQQTDGALVATIEGKLNGKPAREAFTMRRTQQLP